MYKDHIAEEGINVCKSLYTASLNLQVRDMDI